ncbi:hypothetical protein H1R20_g6572, partial [Candolleomyces eurysporus]
MPETDWAQYVELFPLYIQRPRDAARSFLEAVIKHARPAAPWAQPCPHGRYHIPRVEMGKSKYDRIGTMTVTCIMPGAGHIQGLNPIIGRCQWSKDYVEMPYSKGDIAALHTLMSRFRQEMKEYKAKLRENRQKHCQEAKDNFTASKLNSPGKTVGRERWALPDLDCTKGRHTAPTPSSPRKETPSGKRKTSPITDTRPHPNKCRRVGEKNNPQSEGSVGVNLSQEGWRQPVNEAVDLTYNSENDSEIVILEHRDRKGRRLNIIDIIDVE